jgi:hypothetical protein
MKAVVVTLAVIVPVLAVASSSLPNDIVFRVTPAATYMSLTAEVLSTTTTVQGWSFGLCHDPEKAAVIDMQPADELNFLMEGEPVGYLAYGLASSADGATGGVFQGLCVGCSTDPTRPTPPIEVGPFPHGLPVLHVKYEVMEETDVFFCDEILGDPPVAVTAVHEGQTFLPGTVSGGLLLPPQYEEELTFQVTPQQSDGVVTVGVVSPTAAIQGWSFGLCHWEDKATIAEAVPAAELDLLRAGDPVDFLALNVVPGERRAGITQAVVIDVGARSYGPYPQGLALLHVRYDVFAETDITFCDGVLGDPPVSTVVVIRGESYAPKTQRGAHLVVGTLAVRFVRGDVTRDGGIDIGDGIRICQYVVGLAGVTCRDAADVDDNGRIDLADGIRIFMYLFRQGWPPASPFPEAGTDLTPSDDLECER